MTRADLASPGSESAEQGYSKDPKDRPYLGDGKRAGRGGFDFGDH